MIKILNMSFCSNSVASSLLFLGCLFLSVSGYSQFNVKIGYTLARANAGVNNQLLADFNANRATLFDEYIAAPDLKMMFGISLGTRYKFSAGSLELNWEGLIRDIRAVGFNKQPVPLSPEATAEEIKYSLNMLMLTYETNFGICAIGSSLGRNVVNIKQTTNGNSDKFPLFRPGDTRSSYFARFHLAFNIKGNKSVAFSIKPFIQIALTDIELGSVANNLRLEEKSYKEGFPLWGVSFAFYNGLQ